MKKFTWSLSLVLTLACSAAWSQEIQFEDEKPAIAPPAIAAPPAVDRPAPNETDAYKLTPEMYRSVADLQRYGRPPDLARLRAQQDADQRKERLNAMRWYGYSNSRPSASATPFMGTYGPRWVGNVRGNPFHWRDGGHHQSYVTSSGGVPVLR